MKNFRNCFPRTNRQRRRLLTSTRQTSRNTCLGDSFVVSWTVATSLMATWSPTKWGSTLSDICSKSTTDLNFWGLLFTLLLTTWIFTSQKKLLSKTNLRPLPLLRLASSWQWNMSKYTLLISVIGLTTDIGEMWSEWRQKYYQLWTFHFHTKLWNTSWWWTAPSWG